MYLDLIGGVPQAQFDDIPPLGTELVAQLVDAQGGRRLDAPYIKVDRVTVFVLDVHGPVLAVVIR